MSRKLSDYKIECFQEKIQNRLDSFPEIIEDGKFYAEMKRFIPSSVYDKSIGKEVFFLQDSLKELFTQLKKRIVF